MPEAVAGLHRLRSLSAWQWRVLLSAPFILLTTWLGLRYRGYRATLSAAQPKAVVPRAPAEHQALGRDASFALAAAIKYGPWRPRCLLRSLALGRILGRKGVPFELRLGVQGGGGPQHAPDFSAHAWVEVEGVVVNDREGVADEYASFAGR